VATIVAAALSTAGAGPALAQDSLPDPNKPKSSQGSTKTAQQNSDLPTTGIETSWLVLAGVALMATGVAVRPAARLRRSYRTDAWEQAMRSGS
jgi:LPXTG-motif cell wall-anchored protein